MKALDHPVLDHWRLECDASGFIWAFADRKDESVNTLSPRMIEELAAIVDVAESRSAPGLGFLSAKPSGFIAGFDIRAFDDIVDTASLDVSLREANAVFDRVANTRIATVCAIAGFCLGGGLELALACRYRVALDEDSTRLGLPEVKLGLHPGFGGCARLVSLIGGKDAMPLLLTGRGVRAREALQLGIVDRLVTKHAAVLWSARRLLVDAPAARKPALVQGLSNLRPARLILAKIMQRQIKKKDVRKDHYPAPFAIIDLWREHGGDGATLAAAERASFVKLFDTPAAHGLRRVFHLMETLKAQGKRSQGEIRRIHVVGAGVMGGDIAAWCALRGLEVTLQDRDAPVIDAACERARGLFAKRLRTKALRASAAARLIADPTGRGVPRADIVIEAIVENLEAKQSLFSVLEPRMREDAILASNTSALPLQDLAQGLMRPAQLIGLHFFNPVAAMPLVEIVRAQDSDPRVVERGAAFAKAIDKLPLIVKSAPGFLVNRVLAPYLIASLKASDEGYALVDIERAATRFGMPCGPLELADRIGLDVCLHVTKTLGQEVDFEAVRKRLTPLIDAGYLGKKSGRGIFVWKHDKPVLGGQRRPEMDAESEQREHTLAMRVLAPLLQECEAALAEGVVENADQLDAGVIFGTGFAPFRGGPLHYLHSNKTADS